MLIPKLADLRFRSRLDEHVIAATADGVPFACIAYGQNRSYMKFDQYLPALTTSAAIWGKSFRMAMADETTVDRMLLPIELLGGQGWPVLLDANDPQSERLPQPLQYRNVHCHQDGESIEENAMIRLAGNGMHTVQVGSALLFCVLATHVSS